MISLRGAPAPKAGVPTYYIAIFCQKLHERICTPRKEGGEHVPGTPLDRSMDMAFVLLINDHYHYQKEILSTVILDQKM